MTSVMAETVEKKWNGVKKTGEQAVWGEKKTDGMCEDQVL